MPNTARPFHDTQPDPGTSATFGSQRRYKRRARFRTVCPLCGVAVQIGDYITPTAGGWRHHNYTKCRQARQRADEHGHRRLKTSQQQTSSG